MEGNTVSAWNMSGVYMDLSSSAATKETLFFCHFFNALNAVWLYLRFDIDCEYWWEVGNTLAPMDKLPLYCYA